MYASRARREGRKWRWNRQTQTIPEDQELKMNQKNDADAEALTLLGILKFERVVMRWELLVRAVKDQFDAEAHVKTIIDASFLVLSKLTKNRSLV